MLTTTDHGQVGLVLVAQKDNAQYVIGSPPYMHLSGVLTDMFRNPVPNFDGRVKVPFSAGVAYELVATLLIRGDKAGRHMYSCLHTRFGDNPEAKLHAELTIVLNEIAEMSAYLKMPKMLEYKNFIIEHALMYYPNAVCDKFYSGKLRGKKRYEQAFDETMEQIDRLGEFISLQQVEEYKDSISKEIINARQQGIDDRYARRQEQVVRKRKRLESTRTIT